MGPLQKLKQASVKQKELVAETFVSFGIEESHRHFLDWLMAAPAELDNELYWLTRKVVDSACDDQSLGYMAKTHGVGTLFEVVATGESYQYAGMKDGKVMAKPFNSDELMAFEENLKVHRVF